MEGIREEVVSEERWLPAVGYEGWYDISDWGRARRMKTVNSTFAGRILKPGLYEGRYPVVIFSRNGKTQTFTIHKLVMAAFIGPCPEGKQINHIDGNKNNNHLENLEYITPSENRRHAYATGLQSQQGENNATSILTENNVHEIRQLLGKETQTEIAARFGVTQACISVIATGKNWSHLKEPDDLTNAKKCV